jgi:hypothetical protein
VAVAERGIAATAACKVVNILCVMSPHFAPGINRTCHSWRHGLPDFATGIVHFANEHGAFKGGVLAWKSSGTY